MSFDAVGLSAQYVYNPHFDVSYENVVQSAIATRAVFLGYARGVATVVRYSPLGVFLFVRGDTKVTGSKAQQMSTDNPRAECVDTQGDTAVAPQTSTAEGATDLAEELNQQGTTSEVDPLASSDSSTTSEAQTMAEAENGTTSEATLQNPATSTAENSLPKPRTGPGTVPKSERDPKRFFTPSERAQQREVQGGKCANDCGTDIDQSNSRGHHIERHADGGQTVPENHAEVCTECHDKLHSSGD
jgi:hypothetical protein